MESTHRRRERLISSVRLLAREGYSTLTPKHFAAIAPLSNHGVFEAGAVLVGTHAFEVFVNRLGIRVAAFATEDVDVARPGKLALVRIPKGGLLELLRESGIDFVGVPQLDRESPPRASRRGAIALHVRSTGSGNGGRGGSSSQFRSWELTPWRCPTFGISLLKHNAVPQFRVTARPWYASRCPNASQSTSCLSRACARIARRKARRTCAKQLP
jgi:hypothetical protein